MTQPPSKTTSEIPQRRCKSLLENDAIMLNTVFRSCCPPSPLESLEQAIAKYDFVHRCDESCFKSALQHDLTFLGVARSVWTGGRIPPCFTLHNFWKLETSKPPPHHPKIKRIKGGKWFKCIHACKCCFCMQPIFRKTLPHPNVIFGASRGHQHDAK